MNSQLNNRKRVLASVIGAPIDVIDWAQTLGRIGSWASDRKSRYVCICNVHSLITAKHDAIHASALHSADMTTPDGAPVAWLMRLLGANKQPRINGPDLMWHYLSVAALRNESIFLLGGQQRTLDILQLNLTKQFPGLQIAGAYSPPFRQLTSMEDQAMVDTINCSGAGTVWVSLGCPKQEKWMAEHKGRINAVMIGVGAAFDYHAGTINRAPIWMQRSGLEWLYRLCTEPRRLWKRYLTTNSLFLYFAARQLLTGKV